MLRAYLVSERSSSCEVPKAARRRDLVRMVRSEILALQPDGRDRAARASAFDRGDVPCPCAAPRRIQESSVRAFAKAARRPSSSRQRCTVRRVGCCFAFFSSSANGGVNFHWMSSKLAITRPRGPRRGVRPGPDGSGGIGPSSRRSTGYRNLIDFKDSIG